MFARTATLTVLACLLTATASPAGASGSGAPADAVASAEETNLLVVYGYARTWDGRFLPSGMEVVVTNPATGDVATGTVGETARGIYEAVFFAPDRTVARVGDVLEISVADAVFEPGNGEALVTQEAVDAGMLAYDVVPDVISAVSDGPPVARLLGNFPNPFNPRTTIRLEQGEAGPATLDLYDARGALVGTLFTGVLEPGPHEVSWDGRDAAGREMQSGIYFVEYRTAGVRRCGKITLLR